MVAHGLDQLDEQGAFLRWQPPLDHQHDFLVPVPAQSAHAVLDHGPLGIIDVLQLPVLGGHPLQVRCGGFACQSQQIAFVLRCGDSAQRTDLGIADTSSAQRGGRFGERLQRRGDTHFFARCAERDAEAGIEPVGRGLHPVGQRAAAAFALADAAQKLIFGGGVAAAESVEVGFEFDLGQS